MEKLPFVQRRGKYHYFRRAGHPRVRLPGEPLERTQPLASQSGGEQLVVIRHE